MKKFPLPLEIPKGHYPIITQIFGDKSRVAWYKANGVNINAHNGTDIIISGGKFITYGTKIVCPFPKASLNKTWWSHPMSTKGNGIQIGYSDGADYYQILVWHCSKVVEKKLYSKGDAIGYIGNSGLVTPKPTPECPFCGGHVHLMAYKNGKLINPMSIFDVRKWFISEKDTEVEKDLAPLFWVLKFIKKKVEKLLEITKKQ